MRDGRTARTKSPLCRTAETVTERREPRWIDRLAKMNPPVEDVSFPVAAGGEGPRPSQDEETARVVINGQEHLLRLHDYSKLYDVPGLYETLIYEKLECRSPSRVVGLLEEVLDEKGLSMDSLRVLDVGAGNGVVGDELDAAGAERVVGLDIIPAARDAALRDRPDVYDAYLVADLTDLSEDDERRLRRMDLNALVLVGALGFGDMPASAFTKAMDLISSEGWLAFNLEEGFYDTDEHSSFSALIAQLDREGIIRYECCRRYRHRLSVTGEPIHYVALVARKLRDMPDEIMDRWVEMDAADAEKTDET